MTNHKLTEVSSEAHWHDYHEIRRTVLFEGRGRFGIYDPHYSDEYKQNKHHLLLLVNDQSMGTTRLDDYQDGTGVIRLVAIRDGHQGNGYGTVLSRCVEEFAKAKNIHTLFVNAAPTAVGYYQKMGWCDFSWNPDELTGIAADCIQMRKTL